jgi:hypothetical protein
MQAYKTRWRWQGMVYEGHKDTHHWLKAAAQRPVEYSGKKKSKVMLQLSQIKCLTDEQSYMLILVKTEANVDFKFLQVICCIICIG